MNPTVLILRGILAFVLGLVLVIWPGASLEVILILFPIFAIIDGASAIIIGSRSKDGRYLSFVPMGILEILIGFFVFVWPDLTITAFVFLMAIWALVLGLSELFIAVADDKLASGTRWLYALGAVITLILGILVVTYPLMTSLVLIWLFGLYFLVYGVLVFIAGSVVSSRAARAK